MKNILFILIGALFLPCLAYAQPRAISGLLISDENAAPVPLANIVNKSRAKRALTNRQGYFRILIEPTDEILFTSVGYDTLLVKGSDLIDQKKDTVMLMLHSGSYQLKEATIVFSNRKRDSIAREVAKILKNDTLLNNNNRIINRPRMSVTPSQGGGIAVNGLLTELYYKFSKEGKDMVKFEEFVKYYREWQAAESRYNRESVKQMTRLPDEAIDNYIQFCHLERSFIIKAEDYDFVKAVKDCEVRFRIQHPEWNNADK